MNLNPFVKISLDCRVSMEQAWQRLMSVTKEKSRVGFLVPEVGLAFKNDNLRYLGRLDKYRFSLIKRNTALWHGVPYYQHQTVVINGNIKPGPGGCIVNITIRPLLQLIFAWIGCAGLFLGLLAGILKTNYAGGEMFVGMAFSVMVFWVMSLSYRKAIREEHQFLETLFGAKTDIRHPQLTPTWS